MVTAIDQTTRKYVIDTDILIRIKGHPKFNNIWKVVVQLIRAGNLKTVEQVFAELTKFRGVLAIVKPYKPEMKIDSRIQYGSEVTSKITEIEKVTPKLIDFTAMGSSCEPADPWLIAVAHAHSYTVVTAEAKKGSGSTNKIPYACKALGVRSIGLDDFLTEIGATI